MHNYSDKILDTTTIDVVKCVPHALGLAIVIRIINAMFAVVIVVIVINTNVIIIAIIIIVTTIIGIITIIIIKLTISVFIIIIASKPLNVIALITTTILANSVNSSNVIMSLVVLVSKITTTVNLFACKCKQRRCLPTRGWSTRLDHH